LPGPRLSFRSIHLPEARVATSTCASPSKSSNVSRSESNTSRARDCWASPSVKENHCEFQTGFRSLLTVEVRSFLPPAETTT